MEPTDIQAARPFCAVEWVDGVLAHLDQQLAALGPAIARERFLRDQHLEWTMATARRQGRVRSFDELDDHLRIIAGITARLRGPEHV